MRLGLFLLLSVSTCFAQQLPNPKLTPGAIVKKTKAEICAKGYSVKARREHAITASTRRYVLRLYGLPVGTTGLIFDHKIPVELGGANTANNVQPQDPVAAHHKDIAENAAHRLVCEGSVSLQQAQQDFAHDDFEKYIPKPKSER